MNDYAAWRRDVAADRVFDEPLSLEDEQHRELLAFVNWLVGKESGYRLLRVTPSNAGLVRTADVEDVIDAFESRRDDLM